MGVEEHVVSVGDQIQRGENDLRSHLCDKNLVFKMPLCGAVGSIICLLSQSVFCTLISCFGSKVFDRAGTMGVFSPEVKLKLPDCVLNSTHSAHRGFFPFCASATRPEVMALCNINAL